MKIHVSELGIGK